MRVHIFTRCLKAEIREKEGISMIMAWNTGPIPTIEQARDESDWFRAIVLSAIHLERYGYFAIKESLESLNLNCEENQIKETLEHLSLNDTALFLLCIGKIDKTEYKTIKTINQERNKFVHRRKDYKFEIGTKARKKYEPLVNEALRILKEKLNAVRLHVSRG